MRRRVDISNSDTLIIGHRGASAHTPENTLAAFEQAFDDGADGIEFDVRLARDGVPVVIHDASLRRTALRDGIVESLDSDYLCALDAGTWFNQRRPELAQQRFTFECIPTLAQVFERFGARKPLLYVEMKCDAPTSHLPLVRSIVELVLARKLTDRVVIKSFAHDSLREVKRLAPEIRTAALFDRNWSRPLLSKSTVIKEAAACGAEEISLHSSLLRRTTTLEAQSQGFDVLVWTVDTAFWLKRAAAQNLRAIFTNRPAEMRDALEAIRADAYARAASR